MADSLPPSFHSFLYEFTFQPIFTEVLYCARYWGYKGAQDMYPTYKELDIQCQVVHPNGKAISMRLAYCKHKVPCGLLEPTQALRAGRSGCESQFALSL